MALFSAGAARRRRGAARIRTGGSSDETAILAVTDGVGSVHHEERMTLRAKLARGGGR